MPDCIDMGGTANLFTMDEKSGIGALSGAIDGAAFGAPVGDMEELADGTSRVDLLHWFLDKDGSALHTSDRQTWRMVGETVFLETAYTVVRGFGRFEGYTGTFYGRGWLSPGQKNGEPTGHSVGVMRFEGQICRARG